MWIASDKWASSQLVRDKFPEIARVMYGFQLHGDHIREFNDYFSQLTPSTNIRNPFFHADSEIFVNDVPESTKKSGIRFKYYHLRGLIMVVHSSSCHVIAIKSVAMLLVATVQVVIVM